MPFHLQHISNYGTGTPVVARTLVQGAPIVDAFAVDETKKEACRTVLFELQNQLIRCQMERDAISREVAEGISRGITKEGGTTYDLPGVLDLQSRSEAFLQAAKMAIRDAARLAEPFYTNGVKKFDHRFDVFRKWAEVAFGHDDHFTKTIAHWEPHVSKVVTWRNAVDHPAPGKKLVVENFTMVFGGSGPLLIEPSWCIEVGKGELLLPAMDVIIDNTLRASEGILVALFYKLRSPGFPLTIVEIPDNQRNAACPIRLRMGLPEDEHQDSM